MKGERLHIKKVEIVWGTIKLPEFMRGGLYFLCEIGKVMFSKGRGGGRFGA